MSERQQVSELIIHASGVDTWLGDQQILSDIDLDVGKGEVVALLGGNGSGKTTLLRTLLGLIPHQKGEIELFGTPLAHFRHWSRIGYVPQRGRLQVPNATVQEVVMLGRLSRRPLLRLPRAVDKNAVNEALERVGLSGAGPRPMAHLSGGQQQRALIARALAGHADLLVLDEPLAALDVRTQTSLAHLLGRLHDEDGLTIVSVLHELGAMEPLLQRSIVLQLGRVIYSGPLIAGPPTDHCADDSPTTGSPILEPELITHPAKEN
ncbi:ATP-binding cassette domain-containing protein [Propionimicrobium sp. PCR01-08-3]|uniref:metal ABC transporter ATP-binding protein n=1 Tax=Propionimicrobium sp. PCR01-08-3 TaxID=3052086 RepID=UPI00255CEEB2|nr:ATP-binding cassette domain-containing protein [Propionimicrobium sp. PCR01-08-3]WIY81463.1 ATP-binding cassette domain-containing protein [Propionimicrobium sp. PCR01-08-3]